MDYLIIIYEYLTKVWEAFKNETWVFYPIIALAIIIWELIQFIIRKTLKTIVWVLKLILSPFVKFKELRTIVYLLLVVCLILIGLNIYQFYFM